MNFKSCQINYLFLSGLSVFLFLFFGEARAQMFSVQEEGPQRSLMIPTTNAYLGLEPVQFEYKGPQGVVNGGIFEFEGPLVRAKFETIGFEAFVGVGGRLTGLDDEAYFDAGVRAGRGWPIIRKRRFILQIPLQLKSSLTTVTSDQFLGAGTQFQQGTLTFGGGGEFEIRFSDRIRFSAAAIPNYGFSFATGGVFGGQIFELETKSRFYADRLFGDVGLSAGWDYGFKRFDVEENEFDYNLRAHSFLIGITF